MTPDERQRRLESYASAHARLVAALKEFPEAMWQFRPAPGEWTIHEIVVHIADSEVSSYFRCRRLIAEPGSEVPAYDENEWARRLRYHDQSPEDALELFRWLRHRSHELVRDLPEAVWSNTVLHSENGPMTMDDWLDTYERHIPEHIDQMRAVYEAWVQQGGQG